LRRHVTDPDQPLTHCVAPERAGIDLITFTQPAELTAVNRSKLWSNKQANSSG
jgi:hypothetical protein